eukprot:gene5600-5838_t
MSLDADAGRNPDGRLGLIGTLPNSLASLTNLLLISLGVNSLTGTLPTGFCHPELVVLHLPTNQLSGTVEELLKCSEASFIDISKNKFSGTLLDIPFWPWTGMLQMIDVSFNEFEGTVPAALYKQNVTVTVNLAHNRFTGTISSAISDMPYLMNLNLRSNQLSGTINEGIWYLPRLSVLDLSDNRFIGTISSAVGSSFYLSSVLLANNNLSGPIPPELGLPSTLTAVDLRNNSFSCAAELAVSGQVHSSSNMQQCSRELLLPCVLSTTKEVYPRPDNSTKMECPRIIRKPHEQLMKDCDGPGTMQLGNQVSMVGDPTYQTEQTWEADPSYYQYIGCRCLGGYHDVWSNNNTSLSCEPDVHALPSWVVPLAATLFAAGCLLLAAVGLLVWLKFTVQLRRRWLREKELHKNRLRGVPAQGSASIVVTDVESYSDLMQRNALVCTKAMGVHNAILRAAVSVHAGHVIEQEGDSWSVAFHRPVEAVAFCLQVQQALQKASWPPELEALKPANTATVPDSAASSGTGISSQKTSRTGYSDPASRRSTSQSVAAGSSAHGQSRTFSSLMGLFMPGRATNKVHHVDGYSSRITSSHGAPASSIDLGGAGFHSAGSNIKGQRPPEVASAGSASSQHGPVPSDTGMWQHQPKKEAVDGLHSPELVSRVGSVVTFKPAEKASKKKAKVVTVKGLRIRMGVATGWLPAAAEIKTSALFDLAKGVSDMANGGQVLLEAATFAAVNNWLTELSTVDHKGYNDALITRMANSPAETSKGWFSRLLSPLRSSSASRSGAVLLDMGRYWVPGLRHVVTRVMDSAGDQAAAVATASLQLGLQNSTAGASLDAALSAAAAAVVRPDEAARDRHYLQLYTILPHSQRSRLKLWKGSFNLQEGTQRMIKGYCDAPGTVEAGCGATAKLLDVALLPPVTMVFAAVDGGVNLVRKREQVAKVVHRVVTRLMQAVLLALPDGYLCREQDGVLKYMLAFKEAARAAEWCILMQEALQQVPWPADVLEAFAALAKGSALSSVDGMRRSGSMAGGAGQRLSLKMGLAEGVPEEIAPDAWGRADYFGPWVNLAARMMSATASGGQIVLSCDTAESIFSTWRYEAQLCRVTNEIPHIPETTTPWQLSLSGGTTTGQAPSAAAGHDAPGIDKTVDTSAVAEALQGPTQDLLPGQPANIHSLQLALNANAQSTGNPAQQDNDTFDVDHSSGSVTLLSSTANDASPLQPKSPRTPAALANMVAAGLGPAVTAGGVRQHYPSRLVHVSAENVGTYGFKGCGAVDMVALTADVLPLVPDSANKPRKGGKGEFT